MSACFGRAIGSRFSLLLLAAAMLAACRPEAETAAPEVRPVRTVTVVKRESGETVAFTGRIEAENETRLAFRIGGRMIERAANVGDRLEPDQVVARLDPQDQLNSLRAAQAGGGADQAMETARAQLKTAEAQLRLAEDQVARTELRADTAGIVTTTSAEPGEVVQAGQTILRIARQDGRDAVFDVPGQVLRSAPSDPLITVTLTDDPKVKATGRVREVSPQADPVTRTFEVKFGLTDAPEAMRLGSTVVGRMQLDATPTIELPATALTEFDRRPAVWVVDAASLTVSPRTVEVLRHNPATVAIASGLEPGEIVVTAGTQALHPGQKTRLLESAR